MMQQLAPLRAAVAQLCDLGTPWEPAAAAYLAMVCEDRARAYARQLLNERVLRIVESPWLLEPGVAFRSWRAEVDLSQTVYYSAKTMRRYERQAESERLYVEDREQLKVIGRAVRQARKAKGLSLRMLAEKTEIQHSSLVRLENGKRGHQSWDRWRKAIERELGSIDV